MLNDSLQRVESFYRTRNFVDHASYPTARIAKTHLYRLALLFQFGCLLMADGMAYDSMLVVVPGALTAILHGAANRTSAELAGAVGPFEGFAANREPMLRVMQMHRDAVEEMDEACPAPLRDAARQIWDDVLERVDSTAIGMLRQRYSLQQVLLAF